MKKCKDLLDIFKASVRNWNEPMNQESTIVRFQTIVDSLAPLKEIRIKQSTAPWITAEIIHTRSERDKALR